MSVSTMKLARRLRVATRSVRLRFGPGTGPAPLRRGARTHPGGVAALLIGLTLAAQPAYALPSAKLGGVPRTAVAAHARLRKAGPEGRRLLIPALPRVGASPTPTCARWTAASYRVKRTPPVLVSTCRTSSGFPAYVAWINHTTTRLALYPGLSDPNLATPRGPGEVPNDQRWRLLATFNGGFKSSANAGGFLVNGHVDDPLQVGVGTLVEYRDGTLAILDWQGRTNPSTLVLARQNLPPLVWDGKPNKKVNDSSLWGATLGGGTAVWRTAVGLTARGDLVYAAADGQTPASMATLLIKIGAVRALELDINPEWPSFIAYDARGGAKPDKIVPNPQEPTNRYLAPDSRDFFAVYTRAGGGPLVPFH